MSITPEQTVREIVIAHPQSARVFETLGIDYCCGAKQSLDAACARANVSLETVSRLLAECVQPIPHEAPYNATLGELTRHIVDRHHGFIRQESPRIERLFDKVCNKHGRAHTALSDLKTWFTTLTQELSEHMMKEEQILFPYIESLGDASASPACFGSVSNPIAAMIAEHEDAGAILWKMRVLSDGYRPPAAACPTFRALYQALEEFEHDLHWHVHLENSILFPRAIAAEQDRNAASSVN
jgi:regulator of cell morphogenesis and NO signaling